LVHDRRGMCASIAGLAQLTRVAQPNNLGDVA
jgi:hypothetical protein